MNTFTVSFFGHRIIDNCLTIEDKLEQLIRELILTKEYIEFIIGRNGEFDQLVAATIHRCKRLIRHDNNTLVLMLPYTTAEYRNNTDSFQNYYDEIEVYFDFSHIHFKASYQIRNRSMIVRSDLVVFCVQHPSGGAYQAMKYAINTEKSYINLADHMD